MGVPFFYSLTAVVAGFLIVVSIFYIVNYSRERTSQHNRRVVSAYARLWSLAALRTAGAAEISIFFEEIIDKSDFPMILTSVEGQPMSWRNVGIARNDTTEEARERLRAEVAKMRQAQSPVPIYVGRTDRLLGYIYFGEPPFAKWFRVIPIGILTLVALLLVFSYLSYNRLKFYEEQNIWLGMARETAHQLGTPISSMMGWNELLKDEIKEAEIAGAFRHSNRSPQDIIDRISEDILILNKIVMRFGQIGSTPELEPTELPSLIHQSVAYLRQRMPRLRGRMEIVEQYYPVPPVMANQMLLSWAIENLIRNSMEAAPQDGAKIKVATRMDVDGEDVQIIVTDNGKGISARNYRKIFSPGYTTKKRGWGLGLSLAKRIVEEYHFGRLTLLESKPFEKTTFVITFPKSAKV
ncbi:MAG TPA: HAMP domain-containing histidine kinase [candidate division Zixibacteria bacterium]|nr:HAMP domain-containing histidine kinase [candidate division Zixibacteria bacterium]